MGRRRLKTKKKGKNGKYHEREKAAERGSAKLRSAVAKILFSAAAFLSREAFAPQTLIFERCEMKTAVLQRSLARRLMSRSNLSHSWRESYKLRTQGEKQAAHTTEYIQSTVLLRIFTFFKRTPTTLTFFQLTNIKLNCTRATLTYLFN